MRNTTSSSAGATGSAGAAGAGAAGSASAFGAGAGVSGAAVAVGAGVVVAAGAGSSFFPQEIKRVLTSSTLSMIARNFFIDISPCSSKYTFST
jgi:hypothetical protein